MPFILKEMTVQKVLHIGELVEGSSILVQTNKPRDNHKGYKIREMRPVVVNLYTYRRLSSYQKLFINPQAKTDPIGNVTMGCNQCQRAIGIIYSPEFQPYFRHWEILSPSSTWDGDGVDTWIECRRLCAGLERRSLVFLQRRLENIPNTPWSPQ